MRRHGDTSHAERTWHENQPCVVCGETAKAIKSRRFCSSRCEQLFIRHDGEVPSLAVCGQCSVPIQLVVGEGRRRKASIGLCDKCRPWNRKAYGIPSISELATRDGTDCSICGAAIDMELRRTDSLMCPSVDHRIPRSRGGTDEPENLALAHLICNIRKSNRI
ncbi:HNH endonuclease [Rhizomonospora bruguierae]|uniref:HNH endonuclease n=1 Tax=Rhizomonospora bruguierae TaxID=1581705 RepID=UPI0035E404FD